MRKLTRSQTRTLVLKLVRESAGCPLCLRSWESIYAEAAAKGAKQSPVIADHDHLTGAIRGVLCRGCNGCEGRVFNSVAAWGKAGKDYTKVLAWLVRLSDYLGRPAMPYIYPTHVMKDEQNKAAGTERRQAARAKVNQRRKAIAAKRGK